MTHILVFTGSAGPGIASAAAATAVHAATQGQHTLLLSLGASPAISALLGVAVGAAPAEIAPRLDALAIDALAELTTAWERGRPRMTAQLGQIASDELPLLPGLEMSFGLLRLRELAASYEQIVLDAGPHDLLLRALALPDGLRWMVRQLFGLDREPGRNPASVDRAILPTSFIPTEALNTVQDVRVQGERLRALLTAPGAASAYYVLRPDRPALEEARLAIPALQLHGLAVAAIVVGPLLPDGLAGTPLAPLVERQIALLAETSAIWPARQLLHFDMRGEENGLAALGAIGTQLAENHQESRTENREPRNEKSAAFIPIAEEWEGAPALAIELPGLPKGALYLTLSGDELIVRVGAYRRHILLPEKLRGKSNIKATRDGERLVVRQRG